MKERLNASEIKKNNDAWAYALGMIKIDGLEPSPEFLEYVEMEKRGEITDDDIITLLDEKYSKYKEQK